MTHTERSIYALYAVVMILLAVDCYLWWKTWLAYIPIILMGVSTIYVLKTYFELREVSNVHTRRKKD